jgi:hypothetical protein
MKGLVALFALALLACKREEEPARFVLEVQCRECAVQYRDGDGSIKRDTLTYILSHAGGGMDTSAITAQWNVAYWNGEKPFVGACSLRDASFHDPVIVRVNGQSTQERSGAGGCVSF